MQFGETWKTVEVETVQAEEPEETEEAEEAEETEEAEGPEVMVQAEGIEHRETRCSTCTIE